MEISDLSIAQSLTKKLPGIKRGIEKESLRIQPDGLLSQKLHPEALGATLTNHYITTDYSEALPEFITHATDERLRPLEELTEIHQFTYQHLGEELLWSMSMPCVMGDEKDIPIALYGPSNSGQMKEIYRLGLGLRYGRFMQTISGVHYNFSLPESFWQELHKTEKSSLELQDFISDKYMGLIRNYLRYSWLIPLFFGASPAVCESFLKDKNIDLDVLVAGTRYGKYSTSLRMSDIGYQNKAQSRLNISYNSLGEYIDGLEAAISTPDTFYHDIGVKKDGKYQQLNSNVLQIENEFYSSIRPKRVAISGERPSIELRNNGIEYIEIRALDTNPFSPIGIDQSQISFIDAFLLACLFAKSEPISQRETGEYQENFRSVVRKGRHPEMCLTVQNRCVPLTEVAKRLLNTIRNFSEMLDQAYDTNEHCEIVDKLNLQLDDLSSTFSGRIVKDIELRQDGFFPYAMEIAKKHQAEFRASPLDGEKLAHYQKEAADSFKKKKQIEDDDNISFEEFLSNYYK
jgi:glutamate--cysteine ligase